MLIITHNTLKLLAAFVWYCGAIILFFKSYHLLQEAHIINSNIWQIVLTCFIGVFIGTLKSHYLFKPICLKNLKRIDLLQAVKIWNFYQLRFYIFLFFMIIVGTFLSYLANGNYIFLLSVYQYVPINHYIE